MLYVYDNAIANDLVGIFTAKNQAVNVVKPSEMYGMVAKIRENAIEFPIVSGSRDYEISANDSNSSIEGVTPIDMTYSFTVLTKNTEDTDPLIRMIFAKYAEPRSLSVTLPTVDNKVIQFKIMVDFEKDINRMSNGEIFQSIIFLKCEGCVCVQGVPLDSFCKICAYQLSEECSFCPKCGNKVQSEHDNEEDNDFYAVEDDIYVEEDDFHAEPTSQSINATSLVAVEHSNNTDGNKVTEVLDVIGEHCGQTTKDVIGLFKSFF
jgi:hypothetical protein